MTAADAFADSDPTTATRGVATPAGASVRAADVGTTAGGHDASPAAPLPGSRPAPSPAHLPLDPCTAAESLFLGLPFPMLVLDAAACLAAMNPAAERLWGVAAAEAAGRPAVEVLRIVSPPPDDPAALSHALTGADPLLARVRNTDGEWQVVPIRAWPVGRGGTAQTALVVPDERSIAQMKDFPEWALTDPATGIAGRPRWAQEFPRWQRRRGALIFFDLDGFKEINDLYGHQAGDEALAAVGAALRAACPPQAVPVRYGGDEFVVVWPEGEAEGAEALAAAVMGRLAAISAAMPLPPRLTHGIATYAPGGMLQAVRRADAAVYEARGALLRSARGGEIILTRAACAAVRRPGDDRHEPPPGTLSAAFASDFDTYFRAQYARAVDQAREFVDFVAPTPGTAVVEVGAGSGRITFDGGLAARIGPEGRLLVTDPSGPLLQVARRRAEREGHAWLRFLRVPAESLPLASATVDLVIGAIFLHFTEPLRAVHEMARVVRPGGTVAISAGLRFDWPPVWEDALAPIFSELARQGIVYRHFLQRPGEVEDWCLQCGLRVQRVVYGQPQTVTYPDPRVAIGFTRQIAMVRLLLRGVAEDRIVAVQQAFEDRLQRALAAAAPEERILRPRGVMVTALRPE